MAPQLTENAHQRHPFGVRCLEDLGDPTGRRVLVRATLDLPIGAGSQETMAVLRARRLGRTLRWLTDRGARVTVFGDGPDPSRGVTPGEVRNTVEAMAPGLDVRVTEGSAEDEGALLAIIDEHDAFVNDSFQWSHLPVPSLMLPGRRLPAVAGRALERDLEIAEGLLESPERPLVALIGGTDSVRRLHGLSGLVLRADIVLVGGAISLPLLEAVGRRAPASAPPQFLEECRSVVGLAGRVLHRIDLPVDLVADEGEGAGRVVDAAAPSPGEVVDLGPRTAKEFAEQVRGAGALLWCGALGRVEDRRFESGTVAVAAGLAGRVRATVVGGDALVALLQREGLLTDHVQIVSATEALLDLLEKGDLPGLAGLR